MHPYLGALCGGVLIGLLAVLQIASRGRIAGISGIARLSPCSLPATVGFMICGIATVFVMHHLAGGVGA